MLAIACPDISGNYTNCTNKGNELLQTQESIANALGIRREGITESAGRLQRDQLIHYSRGRIVVLKRDGIERRACECYGVVKKEYDRLLPHRHAR